MVRVGRTLWTIPLQPPWAGTSSLDQVAQNKKCSTQNTKAHLTQGSAAALLKKDTAERLIIKIISTQRALRRHQQGLNPSGAEGTATHSRQNHLLKSNQNKRSPPKKTKETPNTKDLQSHLRQTKNDSFVIFIFQ